MIKLLEKKNRNLFHVRDFSFNLRDIASGNYLQVKFSDLNLDIQNEYFLDFTLENSKLTEFTFILAYYSLKNFPKFSRTFERHGQITRNHAYKILHYSKKRCLILSKKNLLSSDLQNLVISLKRNDFLVTLSDNLDVALTKYSLVILDSSIFTYEQVKQIIRTIIQNGQLFFIYSKENQDALKSFERFTDGVIISTKSKNKFLIHPKEFLRQLKNIAKDRLPKIAVISILYKKEDSICFFLDAFVNQSYKGEIEVILIDDCSPDNSARLVKEWVQKNLEVLKSKNISVNILTNKENQGNCLSRNLGIQKTNSDFTIILDADCIVHEDFIVNHLHWQRLTQADVVTGFLNIETYGQNPFEVLKKLERNLSSEYINHLQDSLNTESFLNCITRNIMYKTQLLKKEKFDPLFTYSKNPQTGYGWEDVELGYRLYLRGARIVFNPNSLAVHMTHPESFGGLAKRSLKNFHRLFSKHPEFYLTTRRWSRETYQKILKWIEDSRESLPEESNILDQVIESVNFPNFIRSSKVKKILTHRWHVPHQYELYKLGHEFHLVTNIPAQEDRFTKFWSYEQRPMPENAKFIQWDKINLKDYDLCLLHFDENVIHLENSCGNHDDSWGATFRFLLRSTQNLPKVAICHGTPQFYGQFNPNYSKPDLMKPIEYIRQEMVNLLGEVKVIVNSYQAQSEWGFKNSEVIWHGFDPTEFLPSTYSKGVLTLGQNLHPWYNGYFIREKVAKLIQDISQLHTVKVEEPRYCTIEDGNFYAINKFKNYVNAIRQYSIYFNPTLRSPMPRSRGEAMMCGLVSVSMKNHDVDLFIQNEKNGFYADTPEQLAEYIRFLLKNPKVTKEIGKESRRLAMDIFNHDRYLVRWQKIIETLT